MILRSLLSQPPAKRTSSYLKEGTNQRNQSCSRTNNHHYHQKIRLERTRTRTSRTIVVMNKTLIRTLLVLVIYTLLAESSAEIFPEHSKIFSESSAETFPEHSKIFSESSQTLSEHSQDVKPEIANLRISSENAPEYSALKQKDLTLYAAGFFPVSSSIPEGAIGRGVLPAVELALQHINDSPKILPGIHLDLVYNDTEVSFPRFFLKFLPEKSWFHPENSQILENIFSENSQILENILPVIPPDFSSKYLGNVLQFFREYSEIFPEYSGIL